MVGMAAKYRLNAIGAWNMETFLGAMLIAAWAAVVLRGLERTALAARKGRKWERAYFVGLSVGFACGVGIVLSIKNSLPGFLLAAGAGFAIWSFGRRGTEGKRRVCPSDQNEKLGRMGQGCARRSDTTGDEFVAGTLDLTAEYPAAQT